MANGDIHALSDTEWLDAFVGQWHLLSDLSFSDLLLWLPDEEFDSFTCVAQIRPVTGPTALEDDVTGEVLEFEPDNPVLVAYLTREMSETSDNELSAGIPVDVLAVPVIRGDRCIAVMERHTNQMGVRAVGALEENYLEAAEVLTKMVLEGNFPLAPPSDKALEPKAGDGVVRVQPNGSITYSSPNAVTAFRRMGVEHDIEGENFSDLVASMWEGVESVGQTLMADLQAQRSVVFDIERPRASMRFVLLPLVVKGETEGMLVLCRDTTDLRRRDRMLVTKDATIREIHHRVKNNLQTVAALLRMQSRRLTSPEGKEALRDANRRVSSIALVHDTLSHSFDDDVAFDQICDRILRMAGDLAAASGTVDARRVASFGVVPSEAATSLAMIITELVQNAVEHGLGSGSGKVEVRPHRVGPNLTVDVLDDGAGLPEDFELGQQTSLGLAIISTLMKDHGGTLELRNREDGPGAMARIKLTF